MSPLQDFRWTTRGNACDEILRFLTGTRPAPRDTQGRRRRSDRSRIAAASILARIATGAHSEALADILLDREEEEAVRSLAVDALASLGASLAPTDLEGLLQDWIVARACETDAHGKRAERVDGGFHLASIRRLIRTDAEQRLAIPYLDRLPPEDRAHMLDNHKYRGWALPPLVLDHIYARWISKDRAVLAAIRSAGPHEPWGSCRFNISPSAGPEELEIAFATADRPESRAILREHGVERRPASRYRRPPRPVLPADLSGRLSATADPDPVRRYFTIVMMIEAGEGALAWRQRLAEIARADTNPLVRLRARTALARLGDQECMAILRREAVEARHVCLRAEALEGLLEIDAPGCVDLLARAFPADSVRLGVHCRPVVEVAALGLARVATAQALGILVRGLVALDIHGRERVLSEALEQAVARFEGRSAEPLSDLTWQDYGPVPFLPGYGFCADSFPRVPKRSTDAEARLALDRFHWTTRREVADQLVEFVRARARVPDRLSRKRPRRMPCRTGALQLLAHFADVSHASAMEEILLDRAEEQWIRTYALRVLVRLGTPPTLNETAALLAEGWLSELLPLMQNEVRQGLVKAHLESLSPTERAAILRQDPGLPAPIRDWLFRRWYDVDRSALERAHVDEHTTLSIAIATWSHPESRALVKAALDWLDLEMLSRVLGDMDRGEVEDLFAHHPARLREAADRLLLPEALHVEMLTPEMRAGCEARAKAERIAFMADHGRQCLTRSPETVRLFEAAREPEPQDRALFFKAVASPPGPEGDGPRYLGVCGLERLGEEGESWVAALRSLAGDPHPLVRLSALAGLARRGDESSTLALREAACGADHVSIRAEALHWLGEIDPVRHMDLAERALFEDQEFDGDAHCAPACEAAVDLLARVATPRAMTALLRAGLLEIGNETQGSIERYLEKFLARLQSSEPPEPPGTWWSWWRWDGMKRFPPKAACASGCWGGEALEADGEC